MLEKTIMLELLVTAIGQSKHRGVFEKPIEHPRWMLFAKIVNSFQPLLAQRILRKNFIVHIAVGSK